MPHTFHIDFVIFSTSKSRKRSHKTVEFLNYEKKSQGWYPGSHLGAGLQFAGCLADVATLFDVQVLPAPQVVAVVGCRCSLLTHLTWLLFLDARHRPLPDIDALVCPDSHLRTGCGCVRDDRDSDRLADLTLWGGDTTLPDTIVLFLQALKGKTLGHDSLVWWLGRVNIYPNCPIGPHLPPTAQPGHFGGRVNHRGSALKR